MNLAYATTSRVCGWDQTNMYVASIPSYIATKLDYSLQQISNKSLWTLALGTICNLVHSRALALTNSYTMYTS